MLSVFSLSFDGGGSVCRCTCVYTHTHAHTARGVLGCEPRGRDETLGGPEGSKCTNSRHKCISVHVYKVHMCICWEAGCMLGGGMTAFFLDKNFLPKKKSKRCARNTGNPNPTKFELHRPSIKGTELLCTLIKAIIIIEYKYAEIQSIWILWALQVSRPDPWAHVRVPHVQCMCVCAHRPAEAPHLRPPTLMNKVRIHERMCTTCRECVHKYAHWCHKYLCSLHPCTYAGVQDTCSVHATTTTTNANTYVPMLRVQQLLCHENHCELYYILNTSLHSSANKKH